MKDIRKAYDPLRSLHELFDTKKPDANIHCSDSHGYVNHLLNVFKETDAFMTCESGGEDGYCVKMKFANIKDSHKMHAAILALISHNK